MLIGTGICFHMVKGDYSKTCTEFPEPPYPLTLEHRVSSIDLERKNIAVTWGGSATSRINPWITNNISKIGDTYNSSCQWVLESIITKFERLCAIIEWKLLK